MTKKCVVCAAAAADEEEEEGTQRFISLSESMNSILVHRQCELYKNLKNGGRGWTFTRDMYARVCV